MYKEQNELRHPVALGATVRFTRDGKTLTGEIRGRCVVSGAWLYDIKYSLCNQPEKIAINMDGKRILSILAPPIPVYSETVQVSF